MTAISDKRKENNLEEELSDLLEKAIYEKGKKDGKEEAQKEFLDKIKETDIKRIFFEKLTGQKQTISNFIIELKQSLNSPLQKACSLDKLADSGDSRKGKEGKE